MLSFSNCCIKSWRNKKKNSQKIPKTKAFINKYNWEEITYLSQKDV